MERSNTDGCHVILPLQVSAANLRFGDGATREVGMDFKNMDAKKVYEFSALVEDVDRAASDLRLACLPTQI